MKRFRYEAEDVMDEARSMAEVVQLSETNNIVHDDEDLEQSGRDFRTVYPSIE